MPLLASGQVAGTWLEFLSVTQISTFVMRYEGLLESVDEAVARPLKVNSVPTPPFDGVILNSAVGLRDVVEGGGVAVGAGAPFPLCWVTHCWGAFEG